jgi:hypothetical protein
MIDIKPLEGDEAITFKGRSLNVSVLDFWRWSYSDLNMPTVRGDFAEYLVFQALRKRNAADIGVPVNHYQTRMGWDMVDLTYGRGIYEARDEGDYFCPSTAHGWGVEVKSSSTANAKTPRFDVSMKKGYHVPSRREIAHLRNWSDIYVFALLNDESHQTTITQVQAWTFYLLPTYKLDILRRVTKKQVKSISVSTLLKIGAVQCSYRELRTRMLFMVDDHYPKLARWKFAHNELKMRYFTPGRPKKLAQTVDVEASA